MFGANLFREKARLNYCKILTNGLQSDQRKPQSDETQLFEVENIWKFASHSLSLSTSSAWTNWLRNSSVCFTSLSLTHTNRKTERQKSRKITKERKRDSLKIFFDFIFSFSFDILFLPYWCSGVREEERIESKNEFEFFWLFWD